MTPEQAVAIQRELDASGARSAELRAKRDRAILSLLSQQRESWRPGNWSASAVAELLGISHTLVAKIRNRAPKEQQP